ncbi:LPS-assembly protein LptD, partial [bacterium]|nr:LPS-assembly protein LptD [bacterium]
MDLKFKFFTILFFLFWSFLFSKTDEIFYTSDKMEVKFTEKGEIEEIVLKGNVKIYYKDILMECEKARFNRIKGEITAEGNLRIKSDMGSFSASMISYNIYTETGILLTGAFSSPPFYGKAKKIEKGKNKIVLLDGYITTCNKKIPHYKFSCEKIEYVKNNYMRILKAKVYLGKFNIFYLPRFTY